MLKKKAWLPLIAGLVIPAVFSTSILACTTLLITPSATTTNSTVVSHANDSGSSHYIIEKFPAQDHEPGSMVEVLTLSQYTNGYSRKETMYESTGNFIPQVEHTYAFFGGHFGYMNEHQLSIGETTIGSKRGVTNPNGFFEVTHLTYLAMQRATTAREAIQVMGSLAEEFGYYDSGEQLSVADGEEVWLFEIVGPGPLWEQGSGEPGAYWVAQRIPDGYVGAAANNSMIKHLVYDDPDNFMMSEGIVEWATELGLYDPSTGLEFNWRDDVCAANTKGTNCGRRVWSVYNQISPDQAKDMDETDLPTYIKPDKKLSMNDIFEITRDHYEGTQYDMSNSLMAGPWSNPRRYGTVRADGLSYNFQRTISVVNCEHVCVAQARAYLPDPIGGVLWYAANSADTSCYVPFYCGISEVTPAINDKAGSHWEFTRDSLWWAIASVNVLADARWSYMIQDINEYQAKYETSVVNSQSAIDAAALELYNKDPELAIAFLTKYCNDNAETVRDAWWQLLDNLLWKYAGGGIYEKTTDDPFNKKTGYVYSEDFVRQVIETANGDKNNIPDFYNR